MLNITQQADAELNNIVARYRGIEGDYTNTLLKGLWHYLCDSGIKDDSFSAKDRQFADTLSYDDDTIDDYYLAINNNTELDCNKALTDLYEFASKHNVDVEDVAREAAYRE